MSEQKIQVFNHKKKIKNKKNNLEWFDSFVNLFLQLVSKELNLKY